MSIVVMLMIFGWSTTFAMCGLCALKDSGKLRKIRRSMALWLDDTLAPVENSRNEGLVRGLANLR